MKISKLIVLFLVYVHTMNVLSWLPLSYKFPFDLSNERAQNFSSNSNSNEERLIIKLGQSKIDIKNFPFYIEDVSVAQKEQEFLGFDDVARNPISFGATIQEELKTYLSHQFPKGENKIPLMVRVNRLSVASNEITCLVSLSLSFFVKQGNEINFIGHGTSFSSSNSKMLVTRPKQVESILIKAFELCFKNIGHKHEQKMKDYLRKDLDYNKPITTDAQNFPILVKPESPGVYRSYSDFINGRIDTTVHFRMFQIMPSDTLIKKAKFEKRKQRHVWAVYDGTNYYHKYKNNFHRLSYNPKHQNFNLSFFSKDLGPSSHDATIAFFFGLTGLGVSKLIISVTNTIITLQMDIPTGMLYFKPNTQNSIIIECVGKDENEKICFETADGRNICLKSGEFFRSRYDMNDGIIRLKLNSSKHSREIAFDPLTTQRILIESRTDKIAREFPPFVDPNRLENHLKKNRTEKFLNTAND